MQTLSTKNVYIVGLASLVLGLLFDYLFFDKQPGVSFVIYVALLLSGLYSLLSYFKASNLKIIAYYLLPILLFSLMVSMLDNEFLLFWNIVMTLGLFLLLSSHLIGRNVKNFLFLDYLKTAILLPLNMIGKALNALVRMLSVGKGIKDNQKNSQVTKGILLTLPIAIFFLALLSSADLVFNRMVSSLFNFNLDPNIVSQIWWAAVFAFVWLGAYIHILENAGGNEIAEAPQKPRDYNIGNIEAGILFTTLNVLFLTFVIIQIKYLFGGHSAISQLGFTYAEYAHKGFGELVVVALLTFALIFLAEKYIERKENKPSSMFKILTGILIVLVLVIMASAFIRLSIYEQAYSFTLLRILVQAFIIWLAAVFFWLGYKIIFGAENRTFVFGIFLSVVAFFAVFNLLNPDAFVTRKNINQFAKTGKLDTKYISSLSADAIPSLMPLLEMSGVKDIYGNPLSREVAIVLKNYRDLAHKKPWQSYNVSRSRAIQLIDNKWDIITKLAQ